MNEWNHLNEWNHRNHWTNGRILPFERFSRFISPNTWFPGSLIPWFPGYLVTCSLLKMFHVKQFTCGKL